MDDHRLLKWIVLEELNYAEQRGPRGGEKGWTQCLAEERRVFGTTGGWRTAVLNPWDWHKTACLGGCRFVVAWTGKEKKAHEHLETFKSRVD